MIVRSSDQVAPFHGETRAMISQKPSFRDDQQYSDEYVDKDGYHLGIEDMMVAGPQCKGLNEKDQ